MTTSMIDDRTVSAAIEERVALALLLVLNVAGLAGWLTLGIVALIALAGLFRSPERRSLLHAVGLERITWKQDLYRAWRVRYIQSRMAAKENLGKLDALKRLRRNVEFYQNRTFYALTFILAAVPYGFNMPPVFAVGILLMHTFVATSRWLAVREHERTVAARNILGTA
jgi:hypothetical protein